MPIRALFITGRFRSGSTLLWNIFRNIPQCCTYYEPCHDLLTTHIRHKSPSTPGHVGVSSYWDEYLPIFEELESYHRPDFGINHLYLEEDNNYEDLAKYLSILVSSAEDKLSVLQFNRVDFRLPWLQRNFPETKIIHLFRNPREQWFSMVRDLPHERRKDPYENTNYELMTWSCSLSLTFPFLFSSHIKTSYHRHYMLWKLSKLMGERLSDLSIDFDDEMMLNPAETIRRLLELAEIKGADVSKLLNLVVPPEKGMWRQIEPEHWFESAEEECDLLIEDLGLDKYFGKIPVAEIVGKNPESWNRFKGKEVNKALEETLKLFALKRKEDLEVRNDLKVARNDLKVATEYFQEEMKKLDRLKFLKYLLPRNRK